MKRFLLIKYWLHGDSYGKTEQAIVTVDNIEKKHLIDLKNRMCDAIIDTKNNTYFDPEKKIWIEIKQIS